MDFSAATKANKEFSLKIWRKLAEDKVDENIIFSPFSISTALAMVHLGAKGNTQRQLGDVLEISKIPNTHKQLADLSSAIVDTKSEGYRLISASRLFAGMDYSFLDSFLSDTKNYYGTEAEIVDFRKNLEVTRKKINAWVANQTSDEIKDFLAEGSINVDTAMVLINAIYFKGDWLFAFDPQHTFNDTFYVSRNENIPVKMMFMSKKLKIGFNSNYGVQLVELPYKSKELSMIIMLPRSTGEHVNLEREINEDILNSMVNSLTEEKVEIYLPKFKMSFEQKLVPVLRNLGLESAFESGQADFSGMNGKKDLYISEILQKSFIEVNEDGTEAAAATGIAFEVSFTNFLESTNEGTNFQVMSLPPQIRCCHPFLYVIRHNATGSILFIGRVYRPAN